MQLREVAHARTGDKGDISSISLIAHEQGDFAFLREHVTAERVKAHFRGMVRGAVERYELPGLGALNFVLHGALGGGVTRSLSLDAHGKSLSSYLLSLELPDPAGGAAAMTLPRTPSFRLDGRRALVTGAGRGIGLAAAAALAAAGAAVTLVARMTEEIERAAREIGDRGGRAEAVVLDVTDMGRMQAVIGSMPAFDILVNNAGTNRPRPFLDVTSDDFDTIMGLNVRAAFFVAQVVARGMAASGRGGSIIHISSQMGHVGGALRSVYCSSKHAIEGLTKAMAIDLAPMGIRVNTIGPTFIDTALTRPYWNDGTFHQEVLRKIKLGRLGTVEDLMGAVVFLASDAAALITGTSLLVDGGWTAE